MHHTLPPLRGHLHAHFCPAAAAVLTVDSGDTVSFSVPDVSWGLEPPTSSTAPRRKVEPRDPARDNGPCLAGPVAVRGAEPDDALEIRIEHVRTAPWGWTYAGAGMASPAHNAALGIGDAPLTLLRWTIDHAAGTATSDTGHSVPLRPFAGTIGLCPNEPHASGWLARNCGGNMDCRELTAGSVLWLPIMVPGGMLSVGDGHAAQGDGELSGTAIECPLEELRLRLILHKRAGLSSPKARTDEGWITLGFGDSLDAAASMASGAMLDVMMAELSLTRPQALALASSCVDLRITQMVNPVRGVHAVLKI